MDEDFENKLNRRFDEIGREESQRYHHIDLTHAASSAVGDAVGCGGAIFHEFLEPTAPLRNCSNQRPSRVRANGTPVLLRWVSPVTQIFQTVFRAV